jgi:hypothetical protein
MARFPSQVYIKLDQPNTALEGYQKASEKHPGETSLILGAARVHDMLNNMSQAVQFYKKVRECSGPCSSNCSHQLGVVSGVVVTRLLWWALAL